MQQLHCELFYAQEYELRLEPWLWCVGTFTIYRSLVIIYASIVNDLFFGYHILMCLIWVFLILTNVYAWLVVHSFYHELCEVTRLEDVARVKVSDHINHFISDVCVIVGLLNLHGSRLLSDSTSYLGIKGVFTPNLNRTSRTSEL